MVGTFYLELENWLVGSYTPTLAVLPESTLQSSVDADQFVDAVEPNEDNWFGVVLKELAVFVYLMCGFWFVKFDGEVVAVVEGEGGLISGLGVLDDWEVVGEVGLAAGDAVAVEVEFEELSLFEAEDDAGGGAEEGGDGVEGGAGDRAAGVADAGAQLRSEILPAPGRYEC